MNDTPCAEWASELQRALADLRQLERENARLRKRLEILSIPYEKKTEEYICVDREHGLWKRAAVDTARKEQP